MGTVDSHWVNSCFLDASSGVFDLDTDAISMTFAVLLLGIFSCLEETENSSRFYSSKVTVFWEHRAECGVGVGHDSRASVWLMLFISASE